MKLLRQNALFKNNKYLIYALVFSAFQLSIILAGQGVRIASDSPAYISATKSLVEGENIQPNGLTLTSRQISLRPLGTLIAAFFTILTGDIITAFAIENSIFYLGSTVLIFLISNRLYRSEKIAFYSAVLFASAEAVITWGIAVLVDMGVWFFYSFSIYVTLLFIEEYKTRFLLLAGIICGMGVLMKENVIAGAIFFILILFSAKNLHIRPKIKYTALFVGIVLIPIIIAQVIAFFYFRFTYIDWYRLNLSLYMKQYFTITRFFIAIFGAFTFTIFLFFKGLWKEIKRKNYQRLRIFLSLIISSFIPILVWTIFVDRFIFLLFPGIIPVSAYGLLLNFGKNDEKKSVLVLELVILLAIVVSNNILLFMRPEIVTLLLNSTYI
jgi:4-amino-4-deoxy-L-arabinose transferase-like glycosyltransferase